MSSTATLLPPLLAFGAHPDDIEFGAGGIIALETAAGRPVHFVVCSRGEAGTNGTPAVRTAEAEKAAALLGVTLEFIDLGGDAHFVPSLPHSLTIAAIIRRVKPALVLAPTVNENQHPDHSVLGKIVRNASASPATAASPNSVAPPPTPSIRSCTTPSPPTPKPATPHRCSSMFPP